MNIAVNCRLLQKGRLEGIGWFMYETLKRITRSHPEHNFYFIFDRPVCDEFIFSDNITPLVVTPAARHPVLWYIWFELKLPSVLKKVKADLFFSPDGYLSLRTRIPSIPVIHDINFAHRPKDLPFWTRHYYNHFFPRFARKAVKICTVSEYSRKDINKTYNIHFDKIDVVYNGANTNFSPLNKTDIHDIRLQYSEGEPYFLFIGSIHPRKNLKNLILAYDRFVSESDSNIKLLIVGAAMWKRDKGCESLIGSHNESRIIFTGRLESEELGRVLAAAHALTFVPWFEGFGIPVLEALYAGVPVLTSTQTSLPEVGGEAALYAHPDDIEGIANQMYSLAIDDKLRAELVLKGRAQKENFSWDKTAEKVWNCLEGVVHDLEKGKSG